MKNTDKKRWIHPRSPMRLKCPDCGAEYQTDTLCLVRLPGSKVFDWEEPRFCPHCGTEKEIEENEH